MQNHWTGRNFLILLFAFMGVFFFTLPKGNADSTDGINTDLIKDYNPGFELNGANWVAQWGAIQYDTTQYFTGAKSLKVSGGAELLSDLTIEVEPGYEYYMSVWGKTQNFAFLSENLYGCGFGLRQFTADGSQNGNWYPMYAYLTYTEGSSTGWFYQEAKWTPLTGTKWLRPSIIVKSSAGSVVWFDEIRVWKKKITDVADYNLLNGYNHDFELGINSWIREWGSVTVDTTEKQYGNQSIAITGGAELKSTTMIPVEDGYEYYMSVWGKTQNFAFLTENLYGCGFGLMQYTENCSQNGNWYDMHAYLTYTEGSSGGWFYQEAKWTPLAGTKWLRPSIIMKSSAGSVVWFDEVRVWRRKITEGTSYNMLNGSNPDFENGLNDWVKDWGTVTVDSSDMKFGSQSIYVSGGAQLKAKSMIPVEPGYEYHMSVWGKTQNFAFLTENLYGCGFGLMQYTENCSQNGNWYPMYSYLTYTEGSSTGWFYQEAKWTPLAGTEWLRPAIMVQSSAGSQVWFDEIRVWKKPVTSETEANMLDGANAGFEQNTVDWAKGWGNPIYDTTDKHSGTRSLKIVGGGELKSKFMIPVESGYKYHMSVWGKTENLVFSSINLYGCGFGLEQIREDGLVNGNWYDMHAYLTYNEGSSAGWFQAEAEWIPKETTKWLRPSIVVKAEGTSVIWYDEVRVWREKLPDVAAETIVNAIENGSFEIRYDVGVTPFAFELYDPSGVRNAFGTLATGTEEAQSDRAASLKVMAPCSVKSSKCLLPSGKVTAKVDVKCVNLGSGNAFATLEIFDSNQQLIQTETIGPITGASDWTTYSKAIELSSAQTSYYGRITVGLSNSGGIAYFDNLKLEYVSTLDAMPDREENIEAVSVNVDAGTLLGKTFQSPLDSYDRHCANRAFSYSLGSAGPHLEGDNRWFKMRKNLGINYVRYHEMFDAVGAGQQYMENGVKVVSFAYSRLDDNGNPFPASCSFDSNGQMVTDFSAVKYVLDNAVLKGGVKPILGLETVPRALAIENNPHYKPYDETLWQEFIYRFITFLVANYGADEVKTWIFETGNEPGTEPTFWGRPGRPDVLGDFLEMQDYTIAGARSALPDIFIAGPSGPPESFVMPMLEHCAAKVLNGSGRQLDAISYHGYLGGTALDLSWRPAEQQIFRFLDYRKYYENATGHKLGLFNTEFAAIYNEVNPKNPPEPVFDNHIQAVATLHMVNFSYRLGVDRMAFFSASPIYLAPVRGTAEQSTTPEFLGEPTMITFHGIFKPITRVFQMLSWLNGGDMIKAEATYQPIYSLATVDSEGVKVLCYSFNLNPQNDYTTTVNLLVKGLEANRTYTVTKYELSKTKANSWKIATQAGVTQAQCENSIALVDSINTQSSLQEETVGSYSSGAEKQISFSVPMPSFSATLFVIK